MDIFLLAQTVSITSDFLIFICSFDHLYTSVHEQETQSRLSGEEHLVS
jgi:hypothetical protein